jgi:hypothetical protein
MKLIHEYAITIVLGEIMVRKRVRVGSVAYRWIALGHVIRHPISSIKWLRHGVLPSWVRPLPEDEGV